MLTIGPSVINDVVFGTSYVALFELSVVCLIAGLLCYLERDCVLRYVACLLVFQSAYSHARILADVDIRMFVCILVKIIWVFGLVSFPVVACRSRLFFA